MVPIAGLPFQGHVSDNWGFDTDKGGWLKVASSSMANLFRWDSLLLVLVLCSVTSGIVLVLHSVRSGTVLSSFT